MADTIVLMEGLLGHEWDVDIDNGWRPAGLQRMSETTIHNVQRVMDAGATFDTGSAAVAIAESERGTRAPSPP